MIGQAAAEHFQTKLSSHTVPEGTEDVSHQTSALPAFFCFSSRTNSDWDEAKHLTSVRS